MLKNNLFALPANRFSPLKFFMPKKQSRNQLTDQEPHALLEDNQSINLQPTQPLHYRAFPFRPGAKPGAKNTKRAEDALDIFSILHEAFKQKKLTEEQLKPLFFRSTSDLITYREGWKAGKFWSNAAWSDAKRNGNTNGLISEHVLPRSKTLIHALGLDLQAARKFVWENSFECVITREENRRLKHDHANPSDPWERYAKARIFILDVYYPNDTPFLTNEDRDILNRHGILVRR